MCAKMMKKASLLDEKILQSMNPFVCKTCCFKDIITENLEKLNLNFSEVLSWIRNSATSM